MQTDTTISYAASFPGNRRIAWRIDPLAGNASTNSGWIPCTQLTRLEGSCFADQAGTLLIEFSDDGVNVDYRRTIAIAASDLANSAWDQLIPGHPYVRFTYTNGAVAQGIFRFYAYGKAVS
jgi:hypothetical protein